MSVPKKNKKKKSNSTLFIESNDFVTFTATNGSSELFSDHRYSDSHFFVNASSFPIYLPPPALQTFLLLTLMSMCVCALHQILTIILKLCLFTSLAAVYLVTSITQVIEIESLILGHWMTDDETPR